MPPIRQLEMEQFPAFGLKWKHLFLLSLEPVSFMNGVYTLALRFFSFLAAK